MATDNQSNTPRRVIYGHDVYSAHLQEERTIKVYLPPNYNSERKYPVLFCHDGSEFFTHGRIGTLAQNGILEGVLEELIIVGMAVNMKRRTDDYSPQGARHAAYQQFVVDECLPFVASQYSIRNDMDGCWMAGISLGAAASLSLHRRYPQLFGRLLLFSGAYFHPQQASLKEDSHGLSALKAWMVVGLEETAVETSSGTFDFLTLNRQTRDILVAAGADVSYVEVPGVHTWGSWQKQIPDALKWLSEQV